MGDFVANAIAVSPEREKRFAFSVSIQTNATRIVVSGPGFRSFSTLDELAGKEISVTPAHDRLPGTAEVERLTAE
jgi:ABC-type amino acid transport substrate-binding protein